jgi:hypothetical protein
MTDESGVYAIENLSNRWRCDAMDEHRRCCARCFRIAPQADMVPIMVPDEMDLGIRALWFCDKRCAMVWLEQDTR